MTTTQETMIEPGEIESLLPWYAAGTLDRHVAKRVEEALARDPALAVHYACVCEELDATLHHNESVGAPSSRLRQILFEKIDAEPPRRSTIISADIMSRITQFLASLSPSTLAWSGAVAGLVILAQAALLAGIGLRPVPGAYRTASAPAASAVVKTTDLLVRFAPQTDASDITRVLEANQLMIVDGPSRGLYRLRRAGVVMAKDDVARLMQHLQQNGAVTFVVEAQ